MSSNKPPCQCKKCQKRKRNNAPNRLRLPTRQMQLRSATKRQHEQESSDTDQSIGQMRRQPKFLELCAENDPEAVKTRKAGAPPKQFKPQINLDVSENESDVTSECDDNTDMSSPSQAERKMPVNSTRTHRGGVKVTKAMPNNDRSKRVKLNIVESETSCSNNDTDITAEYEHEKTASGSSDETEYEIVTSPVTVGCNPAHQRCSGNHICGHTLHPDIRMRPCAGRGRCINSHRCFGPRGVCRNCPCHCRCGRH